jgi:hypothetical protein
MRVWVVVAFKSAPHATCVIGAFKSAHDDDANDDRRGNAPDDELALIGSRRLTRVRVDRKRITQLGHAAATTLQSRDRSRPNQSAITPLDHSRSCHLVWQLLSVRV